MVASAKLDTKPAAAKAKTKKTALKTTGTKATEAKPAVVKATAVKDAKKHVDAKVPVKKPAVAKAAKVTTVGAKRAKATDVVHEKVGVAKVSPDKAATKLKDRPRK